MASIFLGIPHTGTVITAALPGIMNPVTPGKHEVQICCNGSSLLANNFNTLWAKALNRRSELKLTHFAMHHSDIAAPEGWLDALLEEMDRLDADVISVVVPIKDGRGLTSTGTMDFNGKITRLTMSEVMKLPRTFSHGHINATLGRFGTYLMFNSGLWVCRFDEHWPTAVSFSISDNIEQQSNGTFQVKVLSEDWRFSKECQDRNLLTYATRIVPVKHYGIAAFTNDMEWGEWKTDRGDNAA